MKKILFLVDSPLDSNIRAFKTLVSLSRKYSIVILHRGIISTQSSFLEISNTTYIEIPYSIKSFFSRTFFLGNDYMLNAMSVLQKHDLKDVDFIYCVDLWALPMAVKAKKHFKAKLIYDSYEICVETLSQYYPLKDRNLKSIFFQFWVFITKKIARCKERQNIKQVDLFVTTSLSYLNHFKTNYQIGKSVIVMNCPQIVENVESINLHNTFGIEKSRKIVLYIGTFNSGRYLEELVLASDFLETNIHILFLGLGPLRSELEKLSKQKKNVTIAGPFFMEDTLSLISGSDLGVLLLEPMNLSKHLASANKVYDFLMVEKPMLLSNSPENIFISDQSPLHYTITEYTPNKIGEAINNLINKQLIEGFSSDKVIKIKESKAIFNWGFQENTLLAAIEELKY